MIDATTLERAIQAEILRRTEAVIATHATEPMTYEAGHSAGFVAGLRKALLLMQNVRSGGCESVRRDTFET